MHLIIYRYVVNAAKEARNVELATQRIIYLSVLFFDTLTIQTHSQGLSQTVNGRKLQFTYFVSQVCLHLNPLLKNLLLNPGN